MSANFFSIKRSIRSDWDTVNCCFHPPTSPEYLDSWLSPFARRYMQGLKVRYKVTFSPMIERWCNLDWLWLPIYSRPTTAMVHWFTQYLSSQRPTTKVCDTCNHNVVNHWMFAPKSTLNQAHIRESDSGLFRANDIAFGLDSSLKAQPDSTFGLYLAAYLSSWNLFCRWQLPVSLLNNCTSP